MLKVERLLYILNTVFGLSVRTIFIFPTSNGNNKAYNKSNTNEIWVEESYNSQF